MRYFKAFIGILVFVFVVLFFYQNYEQLNQVIAFQLNLYVKTWKSVPVPFYVIVVASVAFGGLVTLLYLIAERLKLTREIKRLKGLVPAVSAAASTSYEPKPAEPTQDETPAESTKEDASS